MRLSLSIRVKFIGTMLIQPPGACIFSSISAVLRQPLGVWVYTSRTTLILPLSVCVEFTISGTVLILPLGVYISRDCIDIASGRVYWDSHWACRFVFTGTVLMLPLGIKCVYIDFICIGIATGRRNLPCCYCSIIVTEHICIFIDCTCYWDCHWAYKSSLLGPCWYDNWAYVYASPFQWYWDSHWAYNCIFLRLC